MAKKKVSKIGIILVTILLIILFFSVEIVIKLNNEHEEKLKMSLTGKVEYAFNRCILEEKCNDEITLKELYEKGYLKQLVNPISKEIIDENTTIKKIDNKITINWEL